MITNRLFHALILAIATSSFSMAQRVVSMGAGLGSGTQERCMMEYDGKLVIGGSFPSFNGHDRWNIVGWDGAQFYDFPGAFELWNDNVADVAIYQGDLVAYGRNGGVAGVMRWNGSTWSSMPIAGQLSTGHLVVSSGQLYVLNAVQSFVKYWNGSAAVDLPPFNSTVRAIASYNGSLYAGGSFTATGDGSVELNHLARWNGTAWEAVLTGLNGDVQGMDSTSEGLVLRGTFTADQEGTLALPNWTVYDGSTFSEGDSTGFAITNCIAHPAQGFILSGSMFSVWKKAGMPDISIKGQVTDIIEFEDRTFVTGSQFLTYPEANGIGELVPGQASATLDANNVIAAISTSPENFHNRYSVGPGFEVPRGDSTHTIYGKLPWLSGEVSGDSATFAPGGHYAPTQSSAGPWAAEMDTAFYRRYNQVWKLSRAMIEAHVLHWNEPGYVTPYPIANWPGNGDALNGEPALLAPFEDLNGNGLYESGQGEFPLIRGDQAIYSILHAQEGPETGSSMTLDLHLMHYEYADTSDADLHNTVFENVKVINRGTGTYTNLRFGEMIYWAVGNAMDDYAGCDSLLSLFHGYNGDDMDEDFGGHQGYGAQPPAQGCTFLNEPLSAHSMYSSSLGIQDLLSGTILGEPFDQTGYPSHFRFPGGAFSMDGSEVPYNYSSIGSAGPFTLAPGDTLCMDIAYPFANAPSGGRSASLAMLKQRVQALHDWYAADGLYCSEYTPITVAIRSDPANEFHLYPNPTSSQFTIERGTSAVPAQVQVIATSGRVLLETAWPAHERKLSVAIGDFPAGLYVIHITDLKGMQVTRRLAKM